MDDHPPAWDSNGGRYLSDFGVKADNVVRLNCYLPQADRCPPEPLDAERLAKGLVENYSLTSVELYRCDLQPDGLIMLAQALAVNKFIYYLGLSRNRFGTKASTFLAESLKVNQALATLDVSWNDLRDEFAMALAEALVMNNSLQRVILDRNKISSDGASVLAHALTNNRKVRYLGLAMNCLTASACTFLGDLFQAPNTIATLDLSFNGIGTDGIFTLCTSIAAARVASPLTTLNLAYNRVGDAVVLLGQALRNLPGLRELNVDNCYVAYSDAMLDLCASLRAFGGGLTMLSAARNNFGNEGLRVLCEAAAAMPSLKYLDVSDNGITAAGLPHVLAVLSQLPHLHTLHLSDNNLESEDREPLAGLIERSVSLRFLGLNGCSLKAHGMRHLFGTLHPTPVHITGIALRNNSIGDAGFAYILPFVLHHARFTFLDLAGNGLTSFVHPRLEEVFAVSKDLAYVVLEDDTVVRRDNCTRPWDELHRKARAPATLPPPPVCVAALDIQEGLPPSAGAASYSVAIGSPYKRQMENSSALTAGLIPFAGRPVKQCGIWAPTRTGVAPHLRTSQGLIDGVTDGATVARMESNIGGLLVSDDQLRREFNRLDTRGDGYLEPPEFKRVYRRMEHFGADVVCDRDVDRILSHFGGDRAKITFDVFCVIMLKLVQH